MNKATTRTHISQMDDPDYLFQDISNTPKLTKYILQVSVFFLSFLENASRKVKV